MQRYANEGPRIFNREYYLRPFIAPKRVSSIKFKPCSLLRYHIPTFPNIYPTTMSVETLPPHLTGQLDVLMIDNFDSFTWNLYQQLCLAGAEVTVIRNDAISPSLFPQLQIKYLVISPGPGHPQTDSGISRSAIEYFQGKVPVLGVCMGLECLVDLHGGTIA